MKINECIMFDHNGIIYNYHHDCDLELIDNELFIIYKKKPTDKRLACDSFTFENEKQAEEMFNNLNNQITDIETRLYPKLNNKR